MTVWLFIGSLETVTERKRHSPYTPTQNLEQLTGTFDSVLLQVREPSRA